MSAPAAPFLFLVDELSAENVGHPHQTGISTGERLKAQRPDIFNACVSLLKLGAGVREIKRITGLHHRTIEAVKLDQGSSIDTARKELGARALMVAGLGLERLEEVIADGSIKPGELAMTVGILIDKGQILTGGVTARVETVQKHQVAEGLAAMVDALPMADATEIVSGTGLSGGNESPIAIPTGDQAAAAGRAPVLIDLPETRIVDTRSTVLMDGNSVEPSDHTALSTDGSAEGGSPSVVAAASPAPDDRLPIASDGSLPDSGRGGEGVRAEAGPGKRD